MVLPSVVGIAALVALAKAQSSSSSATATPITPTPFFSTITTVPTRSATARATGVLNAEAEAATHTIAVGASGFSFSPAKLTANVGDTIEWIFYPDGHSVVRAEFGFPCTPYEYIDIGRQGFYSGPESVKAITNDMPRYRVRVNDTLPIFFYCGAPGSCYKEKMIGVINENSTQTLDKQLEAALPLTTQILPGEAFPTESDGSKASNGIGDGAVINNYHHSIGGGAIAGIVIGASAFVLLGGLLVYLCGRRGGLNRAYRRTSTAYAAHHDAAAAPPVTEISYTMPSKNPDAQDWRSSHYSQISGPYRDHSVSLSQFPSPPTSPQAGGYLHQGMRPAHLDHRVSSIAPSIAVEAPDNQAPPPPPVELPTSDERPVSMPAGSPPPGYRANRFSFAGHEADYRSSKNADN
ncbi:putative GPI-anchored cupredoxin [Colletotrichum sidae]|uniref:Putative GPI-anchored cupredoxin n=1 Tax=Colletotrichum sidae TaxID=1347389 RepID=A0A4R8TK00_9PEZI|nr:putative GPI-anchored cupredoxin [Colletotrichum sidae]